ncbi:MAG: response regulator [Nitrosopumilus sp.]|nr:response regulator [Nitrosopumilus sp.]
MATTSIEKNKIDNNDLLQMEYFSDLPISKTDIIVIEPNNSIAITIRKFLMNMGFENIYVCNESEEGKQIFVDCIGNEISVPIIIDDNLPDQNLKNIVNEVLEIQPSAKILIITSKEKADLHITELFDIGISSIIQKPLDSTELKKSLVMLIEEKEDKKDAPVEEKFDLISSQCKIISENRIKDMFSLNRLEIQTLIQKKKEDQVISIDKEILEATCNQCESSNIMHSIKCPSCKQTNIKQEILIEHYSCGEVYPKETGSDTCPKCNKHAGLAGKDYRESTDYYVCKSCNDKFPRPFFELICLQCENIFVESTIKWKKDTLYHVKK